MDMLVIIKCRVTLAMHILSITKIIARSKTYETVKLIKNPSKRITKIGVK